MCTKIKRITIYSETARLQNLKQLFEYDIYSYSKTSGGKRSDLYLNVDFFNTIVN